MIHLVNLLGIFIASWSGAFLLFIYAGITSTRDIKVKGLTNIMVVFAIGMLLAFV